MHDQSGINQGIGWVWSVPAKTVCRVMAVRAYRSGRLGVALSWSLRSKVRVMILIRGHCISFAIFHRMQLLQLHWQKSQQVICLIWFTEYVYIFSSSYLSSTACFVLFSLKRYFDSYQSLGEFMDLDLLDHLGSAMLLSNKLAFLGKLKAISEWLQSGSSIAQESTGNSIVSMAMESLLLLGSCSCSCSSQILFQ